MINWISVKDKTIKVGKTVLLLSVSDGLAEIHQGELTKNGYWSNTGRCYLIRECVTHWAEINLPESEDKK